MILNAGHLARGAALAVIAAGAIVLVGWMAAIEPLKRIAPGFVAMNPATACGFIAAGLALWFCISSRATRAGLIWAGLPAVVGGDKLIGILTGWSFGADQILFDQALAGGGGSIPNRMAPNTAFSFLLASGALLFCQHSSARVRSAARGAAVTIAVLSLFAIIGYAYRVHSLYSVHSYISMALHTAVAFLVLSVGVLFVRRDEGIAAFFLSSTAGGVMARALLLPAILVPVILGWLRLRGEEVGFFGHETGTAMIAMSNVMIYVAVIWRTARSFDQNDLLRRSAEAKAARLAAIVESSGDAIVSHAPDGTILSWNHGAEQTYGYSAMEMVGKSIECWTPKQGYLEPVERAVRIGAGERIAHFRSIRQHKDGEAIDVSITMSPICDEGGNLVAISSIARDVTEEKRAEEALVSARETANRANLAKSEFLSRMSHELRTPMNAILGFAQLLEMEDLTEEQQDSIQQILRGGNHLLTLINEVLDIAQIEAGKLTFSIEPVNTAEVIEHAIALVRPLAEQRGIRFEAHPFHAGGAAVFADQHRLNQVLLNLFANAIKYNRVGGRVAVSFRETEDEKVRIEVRDTGVGIAPQQLEKLFTPFERLGADQTGIEGSGVGLALAKRLVEAMGGTIGVNSILGTGSTFWVEMPCSTIAPQEADLDAPVFVSDHPDGPKRRLLYIEDNISNLKLIEKVLGRHAKFELTAAMQGGLGYELACKHQPDLILLDLHLPDVSGEEVLRWLRTNPATSEIPVVIISADATPRQRERLLAAGARAYLTKPLNVPRLFEVLEITVPTGGQ
ncbi:MAG: two-component system sensor protein [Chthoniobacter sp.]|jgi:PAS domain S-box-containing protein|nr:two-component system sensor protein [Chthoniobacter sp.]